MENLILKTKLIANSKDLFEKRPLYDILLTSALWMFVGFAIILIVGLNIPSWLFQLFGFSSLGLFTMGYSMRFASREMVKASFSGTILFFEEGIQMEGNPIINFDEMKNIQISISGYKNKLKWQLLYQGMLDSGTFNTLSFQFNNTHQEYRFYLSRRKNAVLVHNLFVRLSAKKKVQFWSFLNFSDWLPR